VTSSNELASGLLVVVINPEATPPIPDNFRRRRKRTNPSSCGKNGSPRALTRCRKLRFASQNATPNLYIVADTAARFRLTPFALCGTCVAMRSSGVAREWMRYGRKGPEGPSDMERASRITTWSGSICGVAHWMISFGRALAAMTDSSCTRLAINSPRVLLGAMHPE